MQLLREAVDAYSILTEQVNNQQVCMWKILIYVDCIMSAFFDQSLMGQGIDRHLLGLKLQAIEEGLSVPRIFMDTAYGLATHWKLRTGQVTVGFNYIQT